MARKPRILDLPEFKSLSEARKSLSAMVGEVQSGETYVIRSPNGKALLVGLDEFKELQKAYLELEGRLEAIRMLEEEGMREALEVSFEDSEAETLSLSQAKEQYLSEPGADEAVDPLPSQEEFDRVVAAARSKEELGTAVKEVVAQIISAASNAAGAAAVKAAVEVTSNTTTEEVAEEVAKKAASDAAEKATEGVLLLR